MTWPARHPILAALLALVLVAATFWAIQLVRLAASVDDAADYWSQPRGEAGGLLYARSATALLRASAPALPPAATSACSADGSRPRPASPHKSST